jgi:cell division septation protein DedD
MLKYVVVVITVGMMLVLALGCAEKQEEASALEQELLDQELPTADTTTDAVVDSVEAEAVVPDASAIPQEDKTFEQAPPVGGGYTVQIASCENLEYAQNLVDKYAGRGYEPYLTSIVIEGQTFNRVRIGGLEGFSQAKALRDEIIDKYSEAEAWIDEIRE